jgi:hypothetical protein
VALLLATLVLSLGFVAWKKRFAPRDPASSRHVYDQAGILPPGDAPRFEEQMRWIQQESDVDIRFAFVPDTGGRSIEECALDLVDEMRIGGKSREERGVLLLYDMRAKRLKVEVGYGLEAYFPDSFVGYLVRNHAQMLFEDRHVSIGLRLLLRLLQQRIREAVLGADFDPRVAEAVAEHGNLSGGAGVVADLPIGAGGGRRVAPRLSEAERAQFRAHDTPAGTYGAYLAWLSQPVFDPEVDLFTWGSRGYLAQLPVSPAYRHFILFGEFGKGYQVVERDGLALLYFTGTPFVSPHFLVKEKGVWRMDLDAEVRDTVERVGGVYTWDYRGSNDPFTRTFSDLLVDIQGYQRIRDGDNRALAVRGAAGL